VTADGAYDGAPTYQTIAEHGARIRIVIPNFTLEILRPTTALPDRLVRHRDTTGGQHLLDHAQAQREAKVQPDRVADDLGRISITGVKRVLGRRHPAALAHRIVPAKRGLDQLDGAWQGKPVHRPRSFSSTEKICDRTILNGPNKRGVCVQT
jgi:hypothetical protein